MLRQVATSLSRAGPAAPLATRGFAAAAQQQVVKVPLKQWGLTGNYAAALYQAASKADTKFPVQSDLQQVVALANGSPAFKEFLNDPITHRSKKADAVVALAKDMKMSPTTSKFLAVMAENGRLNKATEVAGKYDELIRSDKGEVNCVVTSAKPMNANEIADMKKKCMELLPKNAKATIATEVDGSLIGGYKINIGMSELDASWYTKIRRMEKFLRDST